MSELQLLAGTLATNCYPADPQSLYNEMFQKGVALLRDITGILIQDTTPDPEDRDKAWYKLNAAGGYQTNQNPYVWWNGQWVALHPVPASSNIRQLWVGAEVDLVTFDGGAAGAVNTASGPMWEVDHDFDFKFLVGPGTLDGDTIAVGGTGGEKEVTLTEDNIPEHVHNISGHLLSSNNTDTTPRSVIIDDDYLATETNQDTDEWGGDATGATVAHENLPPYRGIFVIKRTARLLYVA